MLMSLPVSELKNYSLLTLTLPANYGYCILVAVGSIVVVEWKRRRVGGLRETYKLQYGTTPLEYHKLVVFEQDYHRMLEKYPQFLDLLLLGGLDSPVMSAVGGTIILLSRILCALDFGNTGKTRQIVCCVFECVGWSAMIFSTAKLALRLLQVI